jgi:hypothetical protein
MNLILIIFPSIFQIIIGRKAIRKDIKLGLTTICLISYCLQMLFSFVAFTIANYNLEKSIEKSGFRCGMGIAGTVALSLLFTVILTIVIIIQYFVKRSYEKSN